MAEQPPHYTGHRKRLKEKFDKTPNILADYEILELMLGYAIPRKDVKAIAKDILKKTNNMGDIFSLDCADIKGAGRETERFFRIVAEFYNRVENSKSEFKESITSPLQIYKLLKYSIGFAENELFSVILLNSKSQFISKKILTEGIVNRAIVYPRQIAEYALKEKAVYVVIAHNHPTGDSSPSQKDIELTQHIKESLDTLGITLKDHIIVCKNEYTSLFDLGYIEN